MGVKKQVRLILKYWRTWFQRFLPFVNIALRSRDMSTAIWAHFAKIPIPLYILIRKNSPKIGVKWLFLIHFSHLFYIYISNVFSVFLCNSLSYNRFQSKICQKVLSEHFSAIFRPKIGQNIGEFPYFHKITNISKTWQFNFLEVQKLF